nr:MAG TPA: hypothetical protein [Caudoviricetes sp.]DAN37019.1 MAG TPA: hypothetical protein [Caudoviricetes sp.]
MKWLKWVLTPFRLKNLSVVRATDFSFIRQK